VPGAIFWAVAQAWLTRKPVVICKAKTRAAALVREFVVD
jgi:hypothetical protein